jgi:hypothetical protein
MQHTNYCRQMLIDLQAEAALANLEPDLKVDVDIFINLCRLSQKFMLPLNGELLPDNEVRALDDSVPLRLPHALVALEFVEQSVSSKGNTGTCKVVLFCIDGEDSIYLRSAVSYSSNGSWMINRRLVCIPKTNFLDRSDPKRVKVNFYSEGEDSFEVAFGTVKTVLCFLNALACSNVRVHASMPKKTGKKIKAALPFDTYHVLTVELPGRSSARAGLDGPHRSPREHLRRGHIRRLADGRRVWVNATVVAAGQEAGTVTKDYVLRVGA